MQLNIFEFDFTEENAEMMTEDRIRKQFATLQDIFKKKNNAYHFSYSDLPQNMNLYIDEFEKRGWISKRGNGINIKDEHLKYHTVDEVVNEYKKIIDNILSSPNVSWYETVLPAVNFASSPIRYKNNEVKEEISKKKEEITVQAAQKLGLKHFLEVPSSRGQSREVFDSKWSRENVLPLISEEIIPITDFKSIKEYFYTQVFFFGRNDWKQRRGVDNSLIVPYAEFKKILPSTFGLAALCEATDIKTVQLILNYAGIAMGSFRNSDPKFVYPKGWTWDKYKETLTDEDIKKIEADQERLKRLHNRNI